MHLQLSVWFLPPGSRFAPRPAAPNVISSWCTHHHTLFLTKTSKGQQQTEERVKGGRIGRHFLCNNNQSTPLGHVTGTPLSGYGPKQDVLVSFSKGNLREPRIFAFGQIGQAQMRKKYKISNKREHIRLSSSLSVLWRACWTHVAINAQVKDPYRSLKWDKGLIFPQLHWQSS